MLQQLFHIAGLLDLLIESCKLLPILPKISSKKAVETLFTKPALKRKYLSTTLLIVVLGLKILNLSLIVCNLLLKPAKLVYWLSNGSGFLLQPDVNLTLLPQRLVLPLAGNIWDESQIFVASKKKHVTTTTEEVIDFPKRIQLELDFGRDPLRIERSRRRTTTSSKRGVGLVEENGGGDLASSSSCISFSLWLLVLIETDFI